MAKFIGKVILKNIKKGEIVFIVWYLKNAFKNYEKEFEVIHPSYWVIIKGGIYDSGEENRSYGLGQMLKMTNSLTKKDWRVSYNDLPKKVMDIARKGAILQSL